jgi:Kef-type K+ transport system membrane component KefB
MSDVVILLLVALAASLIAVWFGRRVVAPRIERALDRAETEEAGDRSN